MFSVLSTRNLPIDLAASLGENFGVTLPTGEDAFGAEELAKSLAYADGIITMLSDRVDTAFFNQAPKVQIIANYAVGYNNIDVREATKRGIVVTNTPDVLTDATADLTWALLLSSSRHIQPGHELVRQKQWSGWHPTLLLGNRVAGATLGIVGMGRIGSAVALRAAGFGMRVVYSAPRPSSFAEGKTWERLPLDELFSVSDYVSLHCPLRAETKRCIGEQQFSRMPLGSVFINTARGECVDEEALADALYDGRIRAALDVFCNEPFVNERLRMAPNLLMTPHIGSATMQARRAMAAMCVDAIKAVAAGNTPKNIVVSPSKKVIAEQGRT